MEQVTKCGWIVDFKKFIINCIFKYEMNKTYKLTVIIAILVSLIASDCKYRKDCGGRRKKKVKTGMGGYM